MKFNSQGFKKMWKKQVLFKQNPLEFPVQYFSSALNKMPVQNYLSQEMNKLKGQGSNQGENIFSPLSARNSKQMWGV
jgi:hypothetical protein